MSQLNATPAVFAFARYFTRPLCPECNHEQFVPERSAFVDDGNVRHSWLCEVLRPRLLHHGRDRPSRRLRLRCLDPNDTGPPQGGPVRFRRWRLAL